MVTIVESGTRASALEQRFLLRGVGWEGYETMLKLVGDRPIRLTYDRGDLELMSPSLEHEEYRELLDLLVWLVAAGLRIPCRGAGLTTWRRRTKDRGLEADACFYLASFPQVSGKRTKIDLEVDPPPDLAIEVEISRSTLGRMGIYAALGVPEVWRFDGEALRVEQLQADGTYTTVANSRSFPFLAPEEVVRWVRLADTHSGSFVPFARISHLRFQISNQQIGAQNSWDPYETIEDRGEWLRQLQDWIREELAPRLGGG